MPIPLGTTPQEEGVALRAGRYPLDLQKDGHPTQNPLGRLLFGLEVEGPNEGRPSSLGLVDRAGIHVAQILKRNTA
jgi:hypothetical protein